MGIKIKNWPLILLYSSMLLILPKCNCTKKLGLDCAEIKYRFQLPVKASPANDSIFVGDTIWVEINEPTIFKDQVTGQTINYQGAENLGTVITFNRLLGVNNIEYSPDKFNYVIQKGIQLKRTNIDIEYSIVEEYGKFLFRLGIIAKEKGIFRFSISNATNVFRKSDKCAKANFEIKFKETNLHGYYYKVFDPNAIIDSSAKGNTYYFKVV